MTLIFTSCAQLKELRIFGNEKDKEISLDGYKEYRDEDFINQLESLKDIFIKQNKNIVYKVTGANEKYLIALVNTIRDNNELFFKEKESPEFYLVKSSTPFHFSLPGNKFFFSSGLMRKYIKSELVLHCVLAYELIRAEKKLYKKSIIIPTRDLSIERMLAMLRLPTNDKSEIHKWAYYVLKRTNNDTDTYLTWLQIKNRNSIDFTLQLGDIRSISREEALFKAFLIETQSQNRSKVFRGSSRKFYTFLRSVKG